MNIKPLADRVLVLPAQAEEKVGGIIILIQPKRNHSMAALLLSDRARQTSLWFLKKATKCFMANIQEQNSSMKVLNTSSCVRAMCLLL